MQFQHYGLIVIRWLGESFGGLIVIRWLESIDATQKSDTDKIVGWRGSNFDMKSTIGYLILPTTKMFSWLFR